MTLLPTARRPRVAALCLLLAMALGAPLAGCGDGASTTGYGVSSPSPTTEATPSPSPSPDGTADASATSAAIEDGRHPAHVVQVDAAARTVTVDVVQVLTGDAAASAAAEDGGEVPPPNDYWVRNENDLLRTLPVSADARVVTNTLTAAETGNATEDVEVTLDRLAGLAGLQGALFWLTVTDGTVVALEEQYLP